MRKVLLDDMNNAWAFSRSQRARASADNVDRHLKKKGISFSKSCDSPLPAAYGPDLDVTPELSMYDASHH